MSFRRLLGCLASVALATATLGMVTGSSASALNTAPQLTRYPYLTNLVGTKVTVNWATDRSLSTGSLGTVVWDTAPNGVCNLTSSNATTSGTQVAGTMSNLSIGPSGAKVLEYQWKATLTLPSSGTYCYRVLLGSTKVPATDLLGGEASPVFQTQVPKGSTQPFSFAVLGDFGQVDANGQNPSEAAVMSQIAQSGARFAISTGDNAYNNGSQDDYGDLQQTVFAPPNPGDPNAVPPIPASPGVGMSAVFGPSFWTVPGSSIPMFAGIGNHGLFRNDTIHPHLQNWPQADAVSTSGGRYQIDSYAMPFPTATQPGPINLPSLWYAFDAGNARFYMLETAWPDNQQGGATGSVPGYQNDYEAHWTVNSPEYKWLKADLAAHPGGLKFAIFHKPLVSDVNTVNEGPDTYLRSDGPAGNQSLEALLAQNGVSMAFNGHAHVYQRNTALNANQIVTYVTGGGGGTLEPVKQGGCDPRDAYAIGWSPTLQAGSACGTAHPTRPTSGASVYHFLKVTVNSPNPGDVTVEPTDSTGQVFDRLVYPAKVTPPPPPPGTASAGYIVDGYGGLQNFAVGGAKPLGATHGGPYWPGWNIARGVALYHDPHTGAATGGYVLDGFGGLHGFAIGNNPLPPAVHGGPYWAGWDIARGVTINSAGTGGYVVDGFGGLHTFALGSNSVSSLAVPTGGPYWPGWNITRGVTLLPGDAGGYIVDGFGGIHTFATHGHTASVPTGGPYWPGWDITRGISVTSDGWGFVLDGYGGAHSFKATKSASATAPRVTTGPYWPGWDIARGSSF